jgi:DNA-binding NarL/FixJ family response regulator
MRPANLKERPKAPAGAAHNRFERAPEDHPVGDRYKSVMSIGLVLADEHPIVLDALEELFRREGGFTVLDRCRSGEETLAAVRKHRPDVLVLDLHLPGQDGLAVLAQMSDEKLSTLIVLFTAVADEMAILEALRLGTKGVVLKEMAPRLLVQCVRRVHAGGHWVERRSAGAVMEKLIRREAGTRELGHVLTAREIGVMTLAAGGLRNKDIAAQLHIAEGTVKLHLHNIYDKLEVRGRGPLTEFAKRKGLT